MHAQHAAVSIMHMLAQFPVPGPGKPEASRGSSMAWATWYCTVRPILICLRVSELPALSPHLTLEAALTSRIIYTYPMAVVCDTHSYAEISSLAKYAPAPFPTGGPVRRIRKHRLIPAL